MGLGEFGIGDSPLGLDTVAPQSAAVLPQTPAAAVKYDPTTGRFVTTADGRLEPTHPIDQMVVLALGHAVGAFKSAARVGHTLLGLRVGDPAFVETSKDRIKIALRVPLGRGDIQIEAIEINVVDGPQLPRGRTEYTVRYLNLRTKRSMTASGQLS